MRLSLFQRYILANCFGVRGKIGRTIFGAFYQNRKNKPKDITEAITQTLERLIGKGLLVGYGVRTPKKWYIKEVRLTPIGRKVAKKLQGEQQRLPLKITKITSKS